MNKINHYIYNCVINNKSHFFKYNISILLVFISSILERFYTVRLTLSLSNLQGSIKYLILVSFFHILTPILNTIVKWYNEKKFKIIIDKYITTEILNTIELLTYDWIEKNQGPNLNNIINNGINSIIKIYDLSFEILFSLIKILTSIYTIYYLMTHICLFITFISILFFLLKLNTFINYNKLNKQISLKHSLYNSEIMNYYDNIYDIFLARNNNLFKNKLLDIKENIYNDNLPLYKYIKLYNLQLKLFFSFNLFIIMLYFIYNNNNNLLILPLYQAIVTLIYQFEYLIHLYTGYINCYSAIGPLNLLINNDNIKKKYYQFELINNFEIKINKLKYKRIINNRETFSLYINDTIILNNNNKYLITGNSGVGKSTLMKIIAGIYDNINELELYIDNKEFTFNNLSNNCMYVPQGTNIPYINRSIYEIISGKELILNSDINIIDELILNIINIDDIINSFKNKNQKILNKSLSGGQLHRLILLYWLYQILHNNIKIILLDEPDKSIGSNINDILNKLFNHILFKNKIIIITSHFPLNQELFNNIYNIHKYNNNNSILNIIK